jgi:hypothetical protein
VKLGYVNVDKMLNEITLDQFREWVAYAELEPFDEWREDVRNAHIVSTIANIVSNKNFSISDFILKFGDRGESQEEPEEEPEEEPKPKPRQTWQEQKLIAMAIASAYPEAK